MSRHSRPTGDDLLCQECKGVCEVFGFSQGFHGDMPYSRYVKYCERCHIRAEVIRT